MKRRTTHTIDSHLVSGLICAALGLFSACAADRAPVRPAAVIATEPAASTTTDSWQVGVETIDRSTGIAVTIFLPMPQPGSDILNVNTMRYDQSFPTHFIYSDGSLLSPFIRIDDREETPLHQILDRFASEVRDRALKNNLSLVEVLRTFIGRKIRPVELSPKQFINSAPPEFSQAARLPAGHYPLATRLENKVISLEDYLEIGHGNCVQKTLFTTLIARRLGIPHRMRAGASKSTGHVWIELADGRILDPTWEVVDATTTEGALPGWFRFSRTYLHVSDVYPVVVD